jgi:hypothetical protein
MAQNVYSLNVVGYYNVTIPAHALYMIANQLNTTNNTLNGVLPNVVDGTQFYHYAGGWNAASFDGLSLSWDNNYSLAPGEAGFIKNNDAAPQVVTFVGEVLQNTSPGLVNTLPLGLLAARSSMVPQQASLVGLGIPADDGDQMYTWGGVNWNPFSFDGLSSTWDGADPNGPTISVGQGFFYKKSSVGTSSLWVRSFTVQ